MSGRENGVDRERGAALVEAALVSMLLMMLLIGTVTAGISYGRSNALQTAAREGARFGATLPVTSTVDVWLDEVRDVTQAAAMGDLDSSVDGQYVCVALLDGGTVTRREQIGGIDQPIANAECYTDGRPAGEARVQVVVERTSELQVVLFSVDLTLSASSSARYER